MDVAFGQRLGQIRGHVLVAIQQANEKDRDGAVRRVRKQAGALVSAVAKELSDSDPESAEGLEEALDDTADALSKGPSKTSASKASAKNTVLDSYNKLSALLDTAEDAVVGDLKRGASYPASVTAALLGDVAARYSDAVKGKRIALDAYRDAFGFRLAATTYYSQIESGLREADPAAAEAIAADLDAIESAVPYFDPPDPPEPASDVARTVARVSSLLARVKGGPGGRKSSPTP